MLLPVERAISGKGIKEDQRLFRVISGGPTKENPGALPAGMILCSACGKRTDTLHSIDGRIDSDVPGITRVQVESGGEHVIIAGATIERHPAYETRFIPRHVRGIICNDCASTGNARKVEKPGERRPLKWKIGAFAHRNTKVQRIAAEKVENYLAYVLLSDDIPTEEMLWNIEAEIVHPKTGEHQRASAGWAGIRWAFPKGKLVIGADSGWLGTQGIASLSDDANGNLQIEYHAVSHPRLCACLNCLRKEVIRPYSPIAHLDRHILRVPLPRPQMAVSVAFGGYQRPLGVTSHSLGIGALSVSIADSLQAPRQSKTVMPFQRLIERLIVDCGEFGKVALTKQRKIWRLHRQLVSTETAIGSVHCRHGMPPIMCALCGPAKR